MTWPWESRAQEIQALSHALTDALGQITKLTELVATMREKGFDPVPPSVVTPVDPPLPAPVIRALGEVSEPRSRERRQLEQTTRELMAAGFDEQEIAKMIRTGQEVEL